MKLRTRKKRASRAHRGGLRALDKLKGAHDPSSMTVLFIRIRLEREIEFGNMLRRLTGHLRDSLKGG